MELVLLFFFKAALLFLSLGWILLSCTSASLLLPNTDAAKDRLFYALGLVDGSSSSSSSSPQEQINDLRLRLRVLSHIVATYLLVLPMAAYLWVIDDVFFGKYRSIGITKPVIIVSVPRAGTTSFHRTLALDQRFATPTMLELVMPFICVYKMIEVIHKANPTFIQQLETLLKWINGVTDAVEARHPISLLAPDADDILLGEWHWVSVGAVRTFPVPNHWVKHYQMDQHADWQRQRSLRLHQVMCQKVLYNHQQQPNGQDDQTQTTTTKRLLLRSHLSPCIKDFQTLYPDSSLVGILRDPNHVLPSFAGLSREAVWAATGVDMLPPPADINKTVLASTASPWPTLFVNILADMMQKESELYRCTGSANNNNNNKAWNGRCHYVKFQDFKTDPGRTLQELYSKIQLPMTKQLELAIQEQRQNHETYKTRHVYCNPTYEEMKIQKQSFGSLPGVKLYRELLQQNT